MAYEQADSSYSGDGTRWGVEAQVQPWVEVSCPGDSVG